MSAYYKTVSIYCQLSKLRESTDNHRWFYCNVTLADERRYVFKVGAPPVGTRIKQLSYGYNSA